MAPTVTIPSATDTDKLYQVSIIGNGSCTCKDWQYRRKELGEACRHIRQARDQREATEKAERAARYQRCVDLAGTLEDADLERLIEKYRAVPERGLVLVALLGEHWDREQLARMPAPPPVFPALDAALVRARHWGREQRDAKYKAIFA